MSSIFYRSFDKTKMNINRPVNSLKCRVHWFLYKCVRDYTDFRHKTPPFQFDENCDQKQTEKSFEHCLLLFHILK